MGGHQIVNICLLWGALYKQVKSLHTSLKPAMSMSYNNVPQRGQIITHLNYVKSLHTLIKLATSMMSYNNVPQYQWGQIITYFNHIITHLYKTSEVKSLHTSIRPDMIDEIIKYLNETKYLTYIWDNLILRFASA